MFLYNCKLFFLSAACVQGDVFPIFPRWQAIAVAMTKLCFGVLLKTYGTNQLRVNKRSRHGNSHAQVPAEPDGGLQPLWEQQR